MGLSRDVEGDLLAAWRVELEGSPYEAVRLLGRGGMGAVLEVKHRALGQHRVLKFVAEPGRSDLEDRLRHEAQTLARIDHPHLLQVLDLGVTTSGRLYMVTELLQGRTLKEELRARGTLPVAEVLELGLGILSGLAAAHAVGVVHRDLKPDNLFLARGPDGATRVKVIDFGIAKIVAVEGSIAAAMKEVGPLLQPTRTGFLLGTPQVMSPEQMLAKPLDGRTDIYALGAVLFRCLTGRLLFVEKELVELAKAHVFAQPDAPSAVAPQPVPAAVDALVLKALAKAPVDRFQTAQEMASALHAAAATLVANRPAGTPSAAVPEAEDELPTNLIAPEETITTSMTVLHELSTTPTRELDPLPLESAFPLARRRTARRAWLQSVLFACLAALAILLVVRWGLL